MAKIMQEAVDEEDFNRMDKGLPPRQKAPAPVKEAIPVTFPDEIMPDKMPSIRDLSAVQLTRINKRGPDEVMHTGYGVTISLKENKDPLVGWISEGTWEGYWRRIPRNVEVISV